MKHTKRRIFIFTIFILLFSFILIILVFNFLMQRYIHNETLSAMKSEMQPYVNPEYNPETAIFSKNVNIMPIYLGMDDIAGTTYKQDYDEYEAKLVEYYLEHQLEDEKIVYFTLDGNDIYLTGLPLDSADRKKLLYADITALNHLCQTINIMFFVLLLMNTVLCAFFGIKLGQRIENQHENMRHFFQNVSHELKTPIMSIQGYAEGIQANVFQDNQKASGIIIKESNKMSDLIEELLYISKIDSGQMMFCKEQMDLTEFLYDCLGEVQGIANERGIELQVDFPVQSAVTRGDEKQLSKAVLNILSNALRYASSYVSLTYTQTGKSVEIMISDDGKGIDEKDFPHLFKRFYAGENGNTGIGLALAKEIIELHNGKIYAVPMKKGAQFVVKLL